MTILYLNLAIVFIFSFFARFMARPTLLTDTSPVEIKPNMYFTVIATLSLIIVSGLRSNIGDTYFYMHAYQVNEYKWNSILEQADFGFVILQIFLKTITENPQILIFVTAFITNIFIVFVLYKYTRMFELALFVYITSGLFLVSMNGIRQFLAAAIIFAGTKFLFDGSWKKFTLLILLASTFHQSALIFLPIYFIVRQKAWTKTTFGLLLLAVIFALGYNHFSQLLFNAIGDTQYGHYSTFDEGGANFLRVAVYAAPLLIAFLGRERLREIFPNGDYIVNLCILNLVFMVIASQNWIFARFAIYFGLYHLILISWIVKLMNEKDQKFLYYGIVVCYIVYFYWEHVLSLEMNYKSNYLFL